MWIAIMLGWELVGNVVSFVLGNGRRAHFWEDTWRGNSP